VLDADEVACSPAGIVANLEQDVIPAGRDAALSDGKLHMAAAWS
jgi:hypothetical protein